MRVRSAGWATTLPPDSSREACRLKIRSVVEVTATPAPLFMSSAAVAKPMPCRLPHPVTRATRFSNRLSLMHIGVSYPLRARASGAGQAGDLAHACVPRPDQAVDIVIRGNGRHEHHVVERRNDEPPVGQLDVWHCWIFRHRPCQERLEYDSRFRGRMRSITPVSDAGDRTCLLKWIVLPQMAVGSAWPATCPRQSPCYREHLLFSRPGNILSEPFAWFADRTP